MESCRIVAVDTEGSVERPWSVQFCDTPGEAWVLLAANVKSASVSPDTLIVGHNLIHDLPVLDSLGVKYGPITDTMLMAALLGTEPLGLKALARRHCGMRMAEYNDIVLEARREKALEYLGKVLELEMVASKETP